MCNNKIDVRLKPDLNVTSNHEATGYLFGTDSMLAFGQNLKGNLWCTFIDGSGWELGRG